MTEPSIALWVVLAIVLLLIEASTLNLITIWFAIGSLGALIVTYLGFSVGVQLFVFFVISAILVVFTMPLAKKLLKPTNEPTNADRVIGAEGITVLDIDPIDDSGQVKVMGNVWSAKSKDGVPINKGEHVIVSAIEGVKVIVSKKEGV